jgi:hypothetical protein
LVRHWFVRVASEDGLVDRACDDCFLHEVLLFRAVCARTPCTKLFSLYY